MENIFIFREMDNLAAVSAVGYIDSNMNPVISPVKDVKITI